MKTGGDFGRSRASKCWSIWGEAIEVVVEEESRRERLKETKRNETVEMSRLES